MCSVAGLVAWRLTSYGIPDQFVKPSRGTANTSDDIELADQDLLESAQELLARHYRRTQSTFISMPIAFLQRNLRLGYRRAIHLSDLLERQGDWSALADGMRTVRLDHGA